LKHSQKDFAIKGPLASVEEYLVPKLLLNILLMTLVAVISLAAQTSSVQTRTRTQANTLKVQRANWVEAAETSFGISREDFKAMGFFKLTTEEYGKVLTWEFKRVLEATAKTKADDSTQASRFSCGRSPQDEASATKINLLVESASETPSELTSGVNQRLRSMSDVEIVYDGKDADLIVGIIGYANHLESGGRAIGYVASTLTSAPCVGALGTSKENFAMTSNHYLNSGPDVNSVIGQVVTALDANDFENVRKNHAFMKKLLKPQP
jgi:hypothetical protein